MEHHGITRGQILDFASRTQEHAVSIYLPTARSGADVEQGRIKLKNLLAQAEDRLTDRGMRHTLAIDLLRPALEFDNKPDFWDDRMDAVAIFIAPEWCEAFHLPFTTPEFLHIGKQFYLRPALETLNLCLGWYVLALDKNQVRLVHCGVRRTVEVDVPDMPINMDKFVSLEHAERGLQYHTAGPAGRSGSLIAHGAGDKGAADEDRLNRFALAIARSVEMYLAPSSEPVVVVGTEELQNSYRRASMYRHILEMGIIRSPKMLDLDALRADSTAIIGEYAKAPRRAALAHYQEMAGTGFTSQQLEEILPAAQQGRIDVLFNKSTEMRWGLFNGGLDLHERQIVGDEELLNQTALLTIQNSGKVYEVQTHELPEPESVAAIFRY